jgi:outer membrane receptor protein involved in Fe transport
MLVCCSELRAQSYSINIPAQPLAVALRVLGTQTDTNIAFNPDLVSRLSAPAIKGTYSPIQALNILLRGSDLTTQLTNGGSVVIVRRPQRIALVADARPRQADAQIQPSTEAIDVPHNLPDIIVTAQKREQSINDVGMTITALGTDALQKQGVKTLDDLAKSIPGLSYAGSDFGTPVLTLRGVGYHDNSIQGYPTTSVYVDEIPLPFPVMSAHPNLDLERVELLKGPQGTLFGQNSTGGAINYITAKPSPMLAAGMDITIGRFGQGDANGYISGPIADTLGVRVTGQYGYGGAWQRSLTRDDTLGRKNYLNGRLLLVWEATPNLKFQLNLNGWRDKSDPQASQLIAIFPQLPGPNGTSLVNPTLATYPFAPADPRAADWDPVRRPYADKRQVQVALRTDAHIGGDVVLTAISSYIHYKVEQDLQLDGSSVNVYDFSNAGLIKSFTQELRLAGGAGSPFQWVVGSNYEKSNIFEEANPSEAESTIAALFPLRSGEAHSNSHKRNYAIFVNGEYAITPSLIFKAGARYTNSRQTLEGCTADNGNGTVNATILLIAAFRGITINRTLQPHDCIVFQLDGQPGPFFGTLKEDNVSWRTGLDYKPSRDLLLYANMAKGYKAGSFPGHAAIDYISYLPVKQEALLDVEAGFKVKLFDRKLGLNGAAFWYDYRNKQLLSKKMDAVAGAVTALDNIPKSKIKGAELELTAVPVERLEIAGAITYLDAKITEYTGVNAGAAQANFAGIPIPFTPKWQLAISGDYSLPVSGNIRPFIGAALTKRTSTTSVVGSAVGAVINPGYRSLVPIEGTYHVRGYTLLDLRAGLEAEDGSWRLMVWGKNVASKYYWNNVLIAYEAVTRYAGQPATYGITFGRKFK